MNPSQKQAIQAKAEELYPWNADSYINFNVQQSKEHWIQGATFGLSLQTNEWVSVKEQTPDEWKIVLASNGTYTYMCEYKMGQFYRHADAAGNDRIMSFYYADITHWMPLPTPPNK